MSDEIEGKDLVGIGVLIVAICFALLTVQACSMLEKIEKKYLTVEEKAKE